MVRSRLVGVLVAVLVATACGRTVVTPAGPTDLPVKPADYVDVFTWSQGIPEGARPVKGLFKGPHFAYQFGALSVRATTDETSGSLEAGPAAAAIGHEFLVLYRLQTDDSYAPPPDGRTPLPMDVVVNEVRKRLPRPVPPGTGVIISVPVGADATLEVTDDQPYRFSVRNGNGPSAVDAAPRSGSTAGKQVRWQGGDYSGQGSYQGQRTSGPLAVTVALGEDAELNASIAGVANPPAKHVWLRLRGAKISTDDPQLKVDMARSIVLTLPDGTKVTPKPGVTGLLFAVPDPFTAGILTIAPDFPAGSTAKWSTKPSPKDIQLTVS